MRLLQRSRLFLVLAFLTLPAFSARADQLTLENGDILSGRIVRLEEGRVVLKADYAEKSISIDRRAVRAIATDQAVEVHLDSGEVLSGRLSTVNENDLRISASAGRQTVLTSWAAVRAINPKPAPKPKWKGGLTVGGTRQTGNTDQTNASVSLDAKRREGKNRFNLRFLYNYGEDEGEITTRNAFGLLKYDYFFRPKWYAYLSVEMLYDRFKDLNLETVVGPGVGYQLWDTEKKFLLFEGGVAYFNEDHIEGEDEDWFTARLAAEFRYRFDSRLEFAENLVVYPYLEDAGQYSLRNEASLATPIFRNWAFKLSNILEHDSDPEPGIDKTDLTWVLGLQYTF